MPSTTNNRLCDASIFGLRLYALCRSLYYSLINKTYWRAECYSSSGGFAIDDGTFWGCYKSSSEVYSECEKEAKRNKQGWNCNVVGCDCW
jgi:hypothetical protein